MTNPPPGHAHTARARQLRRLLVEAGAATTDAPCPRLPGLDALRSASMVAVVVAHAATAYVARPIPHVPWAVYDGSRSFAFDLVVWSTISWAMPTFFALGGFAAAAIWSAKGAGGFVRDRLRRIVAPAAVLGPAVLVPTLFIWMAGWFASGRIDVRQAFGMAFDDPEIRANTFGPAHLWFLEYLILMLGAYTVARLAARRPLPTPPARLLLSGAGPFLLAVPTALVLGLGHAVRGLDPILDLRNRFIPDPARWLHHAWFFVVGTWLFAARGGLPRLRRHAPAFVALAAAAFAVRAALLRDDLVAPLTGARAWASVASAALYGWLSVFGVIGLALRIERPSRAVGYLAGSSYWIYLTHFPVVGLAQVGLYPTAWSPWAKFAASLGVTLGFGLLSYEGVVRKTALGRWLNGARAAVAASPAPRRPGPSPRKSRFLRGRHTESIR